MIFGIGHATHHDVAVSCQRSPQPFVGIDQPVVQYHHALVGS